MYLREYEAVHRMGLRSWHSNQGADSLSTECSADQLPTERADFIVIASETSRLSIQEELLRLDLLDRAVPAYGLAAAAVYERQPAGPGQTFVQGWTARDYATSELACPDLDGDIRTGVRPGGSRATGGRGGRLTLSRRGCL